MRSKFSTNLSSLIVFKALSVERSAWGFGVLLNEDVQRNDFICGRLSMNLSESHICKLMSPTEYSGELIFDSTLVSRE